jgi:hypothetical protein
MPTYVVVRIDDPPQPIVTYPPPKPSFKVEGGSCCLVILTFISLAFFITGTSDSIWGSAPARLFAYFVVSRAFSVLTIVTLLLSIFVLVLRTISPQHVSMKIVTVAPCCALVFGVTTWAVIVASGYGPIPYLIAATILLAVFVVIPLLFWLKIYGGDLSRRPEYEALS